VGFARGRERPLHADQPLARGADREAAHVAADPRPSCSAIASLVPDPQKHSGNKSPAREVKGALRKLVITRRCCVSWVRIRFRIEKVLSWSIFFTVSADSYQT
jgi:hypothetical protein